MARGSIRRHAALSRCSCAWRREASAFAFFADMPRLFQKVGLHRFQKKRRLSNMLMKRVVASDSGATVHGGVLAFLAKSTTVPREKIGLAHETREKTRKISGRRSTEYLFIPF